MKPTGPFSNVAKPIAPNNPASSHRCLKSLVSRNQKHVSAAVTRNVSVMSKMTRRAKAITSGDVAQTSPARSATRPPNIRLASSQLRKTVAVAASAEGKRADHSETPHIRNDPATSQKNIAGLSRKGSVSKWGVSQSPEASISRATSALRPSSGSTSASDPSPAKNKQAAAASKSRSSHLSNDAALADAVDSAG